MSSAIVCQLFAFLWALPGLNRKHRPTASEERLGFSCKVERLNLELPTKLLQDIVFSKKSFELIVSFQKNCTVIDARHVLEKAGIKDKQLKLIQLIKCGQRMLDLVK